MIQDDYRHYIGKNSIYFGNVINEITVGDVASPGFYSGKDGMPFFWAEIQEGKEWNWYNDIQGSMTKKPQGKTCYNMLVDTVDKNTWIVINCLLLENLKRIEKIMKMLL